MFPLASLFISPLTWRGARKPRRGKPSVLRRKIEFTRGWSEQTALSFWFVQVKVVP